MSYESGPQFESVAAPLRERDDTVPMLVESADIPFGTVTSAKISDPVRETSVLFGASVERRKNRLKNLSILAEGVAVASLFSVGLLGAYAPLIALFFASFGVGLFAGSYAFDKNPATALLTTLAAVAFFCFYSVPVAAALATIAPGTFPFLFGLQVAGIAVGLATSLGTSVAFNNR